MSKVWSGSKVTGILITFFVAFILISALYPMFEKSVNDLRTTAQNSTNTNVSSYIPDLLDYVPFLLLLAIVVGAIIYFARWLT